MKFVRISGRLGLLPLAATLSLFLTIPCSARADATTDLADAYQLFRAGKPAEALAKYQAVLAADSSPEQQSQALFWIGIVQESSDQNDAAIASFEALAALAPNYRWAEVTHKLAMRYKAKDDTARAQYFFDQMRQRRDQETDPKNKARADLLIGDYLKQGGEWGKAFQHFQSIRGLYPDHAEDILFQIAYAGHSAGKYDQAIAAGEEYTQKYRNTSRFEEAAFRLVEDYNYADRFKDSLDFLNTLEVTHPQWRARILLTKADTLEEGHRNHADSNAIAQQVIDENSDPYQAYLAKYRLAWTYLHRQHDVAKARPIFEEIVALYPKDNLAVEIAADIAESYNITGDHRKAAALYADALQKYPCPVQEWDAWIRYMEGHSYLRAKDQEAARTAWTELVVRHKDSSWTALAQKEMAGWN